MLKNKDLDWLLKLLKKRRKRRVSSSTVGAKEPKVAGAKEAGEFKELDPDVPKTKGGRKPKDDNVYRPNWIFVKQRTSFKTKKALTAYGEGLAYQYGVYKGISSGYSWQKGAFVLKKERKKKDKNFIPHISDPIIENIAYNPPSTYVDPTGKYYKYDDITEAVAFLTGKKAKKDWFSRPEYIEVEVFPDFYAPMTNMLIKMQLIANANPKTSDYLKTQLMKTMMQNPEFATSLTRWKPPTEQKFDSNILKFARAYGFELEPYFRRYGTLGYVHFAEDIIKDRKNRSNHEVLAAFEFLNKYQHYGPIPKDKFYYKILLRNTKAIDNKFAVPKMILKLRDLSPIGSGLKPYFTELLKKYHRDNKLQLADLLIAREQGGKKFEEMLNKLRETASFSWLERQLEQDFMFTTFKEIDARIKKLFGKYDSVDVAYAIAKGRNRVSYSDLIQYIKLNKEYFIDPVNLESLQESAAFRDFFFDAFNREWGKEEAEQWFTDYIMKGEAGYKLTDTRRNEMMQAKLHKRITSETQKFGGYISNYSPVTEAIYKSVTKTLTKLGTKEGRFKNRRAYLRWRRKRKKKK